MGLHLVEKSLVAYPVEKAPINGSEAPAELVASEVGLPDFHVEADQILDDPNQIVFDDVLVEAEAQRNLFLVEDFENLSKVGRPVGDDGKFAIADRAEDRLNVLVFDGDEERMKGIHLLLDVAGNDEEVAVNRLVLRAVGNVAKKFII